MSDPYGNQYSRNAYSEEQPPKKDKGFLGSLRDHLPSAPSFFKGRSEVSEVDLENERRQQERLERLRKLESKQLANAEEREKRNRQTEEFYTRSETSNRERQEATTKKLKEMERQRELKTVEADEEYQKKMAELYKIADSESTLQSQRHAQELERSQQETDWRIQQKRQETENVINSIHNETKRNDEESNRKQQETIELMHETQRLAEERRQQHEREMKELQEQTRIELERSRAMWEERKRQLDEQMKYMEQVMMQRIWSIKLENHFTSRLNFLRTSNREISRNHSLFMEVLMIVKRKVASGKEMPVDLVQSKLEVLKKSIAAEKELMENESLNIASIVSKGQWLFLVSVKDAIDDVVQSCNRFDNLLSNLDLSNLEEYTGRLKAAHVDLCGKCDAIPTFEYLKSTFIPQNYASSPYQAIDDEPSQFKIEEIE